MLHCDLCANTSSKKRGHHWVRLILTFCITFLDYPDPLWRVMALVATFVTISLLILATIFVTVVVEIVKKQAQVIIRENLV
jgi:hypothetical protein